ncbi:MAG: T9SS type A sorting domain-containing protein [Bacteroidia bacterium]
MKAYVKCYIQMALTVFCVLVFFNLSHAQSLQRQSIGSGGGASFSDGVLVQQTVGQPYSTNTSYDNGIDYRPGFQQPVFKVSLIKTSINMDVFPNPATSWVTLKSSKTLTNAFFQVVDLNGRLVFKENFNEFNSYTLKCDDWSNGTYLLSLTDQSGNSYSSKLIILK